MHSSFVLTVFVMLIGVINCQTFHFGQCPSLDVKKDFDLAQYTGKWYEYSKNRRYWIIMDSGLKCASETYTFDDNSNDTILVHNEAQRVINNRPVSVKAVGKHVANGKLLFSFNDLTLHGVTTQEAPYWILDTDYTNYAVVWSCSERSGINAQVMWILTREIIPDPSVVRTAMQVLSRNGLGRTSMISTNHRSNCRANYRDVRYPFLHPIFLF